MTEQAKNHPYYPRDLNIPNYIKNDLSYTTILGVFFSITLFVLVSTWLFSGRRDHLKGRFLTRMKICWFVACALIHGILEGYFSINHKTMPQDQSMLGQMWKEYGKGDSRYVTGDPFTVCMETITAFIDGPLAAMAAFAFLYNRPSRHVVQLLVSLCQLYGDVLYMSTEIFEGCPHGPLFHPLYFWFYFVFMNVFWIIIPFICIVESSIALMKAQKSADRYEIRGKKSS